MTKTNDASSLHELVAKAQNKKLETISSFKEALSKKNSYLIMEGDDGGQIYLVCPMSLIKCDEEVLDGLLKKLDAMAWKDISMARLYYEILIPNSIVPGGMGGGIAEEKLWVHKEFENNYSDIQKMLVCGKS